MSKKIKQFFRSQKKVRHLVSAILVIFFVSLMIQNYSNLFYNADQISTNKGFDKRYFRYATNFSDADVTRLLSVMDRAAAAGYNGLVLEDNRGQFSTTNPSEAFKNRAKQISAKAKSLNMTLVPGSFSQVDPIDDLLALGKDSSELAEAFPVKNASYTVSDGANLSVNIPNPDFEFWSASIANQPSSWYVDSPGKVVLRDSNIKQNGSSSLRIENTSNRTDGSYFGRVNSYFIPVLSNHVYTLSYWYKTKDLTLDPNKIFSYLYGAPESEQNPVQIGGASVCSGAATEWTNCQLKFKTKDYAKIKIYFGVWEKMSGQIWLDNISIANNGVDDSTKASLVAIPDSTVINYSNFDFENWNQNNINTPTNFSVDKAGTVAFKDQTIKHSGDSSIRLENSQNNQPNGLARLYNSVPIAVNKFSSLIFSDWLKTENINTPDSIKTTIYGLSPGMGNEVESTQDWTEYKIKFNSKSFNKIKINLGVWNTISTGKFWIDDLKLSKISSDSSLSNVVITNNGIENTDTTGGIKNFTFDYPQVSGDATVAHSGNYSAKFEQVTTGQKQIERLISGFVDIEPNSDYEFSVWLKTDNFSLPNEIKQVIYGYDDSNNATELYNGDSDQTILYSNGYSTGIVASTQDWRQYQAGFNTLDKTRIQIYVGVWSNTTGKFWYDDFSLEQTATKLITRASLPSVVKDENNTVYQDQKDYIIHSDKIEIPVNSAIKAGQKLTVSAYQKATSIDGLVTANFCNQSAFDYMKDDVNRLSNLFSNPGAYFTTYDEWRTANWDPSCATQNNNKAMTAGEYMAMVMKKTETTIKTVNPNAEVYVWSDMYDPYHNAINNYYATNGSVESSWEGLSDKTIVANWNTESTIDPRTGQSKFASSLRFFANRGNHQLIAAYYDDRTLKKENFIFNTLTQLESEAGGLPNIDGYMYTTWTENSDGTIGNYEDLEAVASFWRSKGKWVNEINSGNNSNSATTTNNASTNQAPNSNAVSTAKSSNTNSVNTASQTQTSKISLVLQKFNYKAGRFDYPSILNRETVTIKNTGSSTVNLGAWKLKNSRNVTVSLPNYALKPGQSVTIHSGRRTKWVSYKVKIGRWYYRRYKLQKIYTTTGNIYLQRTKELWKNKHDTMSLISAANNIIIRKSY